ncbi:Flp/Fap pilin component [Chlorobaculum parvum NCIB 8327]|uniref:Flp/Fap pilin component n=1 Tax=Chlorobaculum parvum (strain DSM 263 / NCIMB 8327) TaxID=517417 RepID=B3QPL7_CHLP8|nr:Flp family type IVb pilin [Chlorobaculum parvum]ACF11870.1 Flp/Fap pilin component [Chlorobaculum parvum NCIB 8327]
MSTNFYAIKLFVEALLSKYFGVKSQKGVTMIEYALIAALIAVIAIATITTVGTNLNSVFNRVGTALN